MFSQGDQRLSGRLCLHAAALMRQDMEDAVLQDLIWNAEEKAKAQKLLQS